MGNNKVVCFGEMLWDVVSDKKHPGGAPLNVAYHLAKFGTPVSIASRVGSDIEGTELLQLVESWKIDTDLVQVDSTHGSGEVNAILLDNGEVEYAIKNPVAWDFIERTSLLKEKVRESNCFIYGSLSARNPQSRETLLELLDEANFKMFDVNLRAPHYEANTLAILLEKADVLKLNSLELIELNKLIGFSVSSNADEAKLVNSLMGKFSIGQVVLTKGKDGAALYSDGKKNEQTSDVVIQVKDTIGCGDAFLASFIASYLRGEPAEQSLKKAVCMGAFIATKSGGCPPYILSELEDFCAYSLSNN